MAQVPVARVEESCAWQPRPTSLLIETAVAKFIEVDYLSIIIFVIVGMMLFLHFTFDILAIIEPSKDRV